MISFSNFLSFVLLLQVITGAPVAKLITRVHTAEAVTKTNTYTTGTTTVNLPPVEIFISNGVTYTFTLTDQAAGTPTTTTSVYTDSGNSNDNNNNESENDSNDNDSNNNNNNNNSPSQVAATEATTTEATTTEATSTDAANTGAATTDSNNNNASSQISAVASPTSTTNGGDGSPMSDNAQLEYTPEVTGAPSGTDTDSQATTSASANQDTTSTVQSSQSVSSSEVSGSISAPTAIAYSPYANDGGCKDSSTIKSDLQLISSKGINKIRVYGTDCGLYDTILPTAKDLDMTINQGFWISDAGVDSIDDAVSEFIDWTSENGFDTIDFITVGNEAINSNYCTVSELISKIQSVKSKLQSAGYKGKVTTSEPPASFVDNPSLCKDSNIDFAGINVHSYFNTDIGASLAGWYVTSEQEIISKLCDMDAVITETGYPSKGDSNGDNYPSAANQKIAIESIIEKTNSQATILTTFNDMWKEPGPYGIEQYFGVIDLFN